MQPYLFPYLGYFQLINAVDFFGIGDDVQFIKSGWINRNRLYCNNKIVKYSFSIKKDSSFKIIKERYYHKKFKKEQEKFLRILYLYYHKAPHYDNTIELIEKIFEFDSHNVSLFNSNQLKLICNYLGIDTKIINSSSWKIDSQFNKNLEERIESKLIKLNKKLNVNHFINPIGGVNLYNKNEFSKFNFKLNFLKTNQIVYKQFHNDFVSDLSIIDVLMFNSVNRISEMLNEFTLV